MSAKLYDDDIALWAERQAEALRRHSGNEIDWENVAEEIESLSRNDKRAIYNRLVILCQHLLKWQFQSGARSKSWRSSVTEARSRIGRLLRESPSLRSYPAVVLVEAYADGRKLALIETEIADLPQACPWTIEQMLDPDFWPES